MSANEIYEAYEKHAPKNDFSVVNYANGDMV
jgi:bisphosphoglycerate-independent phosphoglycerate mutase (AlkP superfamily)